MRFVVVLLCLALLPYSRKFAYFFSGKNVEMWSCLVVPSLLQKVSEFFDRKKVQAEGGAPYEERRGNDRPQGSVRDLFPPPSAVVSSGTVYACTVKKDSL